jgi:hypothetical protein
MTDRCLKTLLLKKFFYWPPHNQLYGPPYTYIAIALCSSVLHCAIAIYIYYIDIAIRVDELGIRLYSKLKPNLGIKIISIYCLVEEINVTH